MGIYGKYTFMQAGNTAIKHSLIHEPAEERHHGVIAIHDKGFGMPLHTYYAAAIRSLHALNDTIGRSCRNLKPGRNTADSLVMESVNRKLFLPEDGGEFAARHKSDIVCCHAALYRFLVVIEQLHTQGGIYILMHTATECSSEGLYAAAYSKDWQ